MDENKVYFEYDKENNNLVYFSEVDNDVNTDSAIGSIAIKKNALDLIGWDGFSDISISIGL